MGMPVLYTQSMTNAPELLSRLQEVGRCMALPFPSAAHEVRTACRALAHTTEAEGPEIAAAGQDLAKAAEGGLQDASSNLHLHLCLQTLMARIQTAATSSQAGRIWAAAQNLAELLLVTGKFARRRSGAELDGGVPASPVRSGGRTPGVQQLRVCVGVAAASRPVRSR